MAGSASLTWERSGLIRGADSLSLRKARLPTHIRRHALTHVCRATLRSGQLQVPVTLTSLRKRNKAQLIRQAQQLELEVNGTKEDLIGRLLAALNSGTGTHKLKQTAKQEDMEQLQAEVAGLDLKLGAMNLALAETTSAREAERQQLATIVADMSSMRHLWQQDLQHVETLTSIAAGDLEHSERDILNLRSQQNRFAERIALMQRLLKDREAEVVALTAQLGEFRQPALALASAASLWESSETSAVAGQPPRFEPVSASTWAGATTSLSWDDAAAPPGNQLWLADAVHSETLPLANDGDDSSRQPKAPALAIVAALQKGTEAWDALKSILPQDKRFIADVMLALGATAAYVNMCS